MQTGTGYTETLADNTIVASNTNITLVSPSNSIIDYGIFRANTTQVGTIKITQFSGNAHFVDDSVVNGPVGVVFDVVANGNNVIVTYTTTSTGTPATFKYNIRSFI